MVLKLNKNPYGTSGIEIFGGYFQEEYLQELRNDRWADIVDKMRRSDAQIKMVLSAVQMPIKSAHWSIPAVSDDPLDQEIADFASFVLFENMGNQDGVYVKTFDDFLTEALSYLAFGYSVFEVVHKVVKNHPVWGNYVGIKDLAWRSPRTIERWNLAHNGAIETITQQAYGDLDSFVDIPANALMVFTHDKEGANYVGISPLRPCYGAWYRKQIYLKIQAIGLERGGLGVPLLNFADGVSPESDEAEKVMEELSLFTSHQNGYFAMPFGYEMKEFKLNHDAKSLLESIQYEDTLIAKSFLAGFLELGTGGSGGSRALSEDLSNNFLNSIQIYGDYIAEVLNRRIIKPIIDMKFPNVTEYPKLRVTGIKKQDNAAMADIIVKLVQSGAYEASEQLREHIADTFDLPYVDKSVDSLDSPINKSINENADAADGQDVSLSETVGNPKNVSSFIDKNAKVLREKMMEYLTARSDAMIDTIINKFNKRTGNRKRRAAIDTTMKGKRAYGRMIKSFLVDLANQSTDFALQELDLPFDVKLDELDNRMKQLPKQTQDKINNEVDLIVDDHYNGTEKQARYTYQQYVDQTDSGNEMKKLITASVAGYIGGASIRVGATDFSASIVNESRYAVFDEPEVFEAIESFVYRNPSPVAAICVELQGRVFSKEEYKTSTNLPPNHHNCKSWIEPITVFKKRKPSVSPLGLTPTGTEEQVAKILKSKTF